MYKVKNTETFIQRSKEVHGDYYDYSFAKYHRKDDKIILICPIHGQFSIIARAHTSNGQGCGLCKRKIKNIPLCGRIKRNPELLKTGERKCARCGNVLDLHEFGVCNTVVDGLSSTCKKCMNEICAIYRAKKPPVTKEQMRIISKKNWERHKELHKNEIETKRRKREELFSEKRENAGIARMVRSRIRDVVKRCGGVKAKHTLEYLGCDIKYFRSYIESKFKEDMTWQNHNYYGWHLDHIIPCVMFDLKNEEEIKKCFHYTNYQPLWRLPNQQKGGRYIG